MTRTAAAGAPNGRVTALDVEAVRRDFPILHQTVHDKPLVYLDNAATTQKPRAVIDAITHFYSTDNSNVHRGLHELSQRATDRYEGARETMQRFLNAASPRECVFVRGTTEAINLVVNTLGRRVVGAGDEVVITAMEHHSNIVPWQMLCEEKGSRLRVVPVNDAGEIMMEEFEKFLGPRTRFVSVVHQSNALGTINPVARITALARDRGIPVLIDGAQAAAHQPIDVRAIGCDFYALSGHKMYGPSGIGVLYGRLDRLEAMPPWQGGGEMISSVSFEKTHYAKVPHKFEGGTPNISGAVGLAAAVEYLESIGSPAVAAHEADLLDYATTTLGRIAGLRIIGTAREKSSVISFVLDRIHPHDIGTILDQEGIAIRAGHHCTQPLMDRFGVPATARASFALYNTREEIDILARGIERVLEVLS